MQTDEIKKGTGYFLELAQRFWHENIACGEPGKDRLPMLLDGREVGLVTLGGSMRIRKEFIDDPEASDLYHRAGAVAAEVREYMTLLEAAPSLKASRLSDPYKLLVDFNGYVLGGMESIHGVQFTTWQWTYDKDGLTLGNYFGNDYAASKRDFAIRTGLVQEEKQFTPEQLTAMYRCTEDALNYGLDISFEQDTLIRSAQSLIEEAVPDLQQRIAAQQEQGQEPQCEQTM